MTTNTRVRDLIAVTGQLITLMNHEADLLEAMKAEKISEFQKEKGLLAERYATLVKELRGEPELMKAMADAVRAELKELLEQFNATAKRNEKALRIAREVNERIVKAIVDATQQQRAAVGPYSTAGVQGASASGRASRAKPLSMVVDRSL
jgi:division protein CdvB (Snf7/Vps24/ESCRT-III family)